MMNGQWATKEMKGEKESEEKCMRKKVIDTVRNMIYREINGE